MCRWRICIWFLGMSHHATEDLAVMRALPEVTVLAPGDLVEAECATRAVYSIKVLVI